MSSSIHPGSREFARLLDGLYDAAVSQDSWDPCLRTLSEAFGGVGPGLTIGHGRDGADVWGLDVSESRLGVWRDRFAGPLQLAAVRHKLGDCFIASEITHIPEWSAMLGEWIRPQGFWDLIQGHVFEGGTLYGFGVFRERGGGEFDRNEIALMNSVLPHAARALQLRTRLAGIVGAHEAATAALNALSIGFVLLDHRARVLEASDAAKRILDAGDGLTIRADEIIARDRRSGSQLALLLGELADDSGHSGGLLPIQRVSGRRAYSLLAMRLPPDRFELSRRTATVVVFISDPEENFGPSDLALADLFGLTRAEAGIASLLAAGRSPNEISEERGLAVQTVRNHLKSIYRKTATSRQAELVRLLLTGVARLGRG